MNDADLTKYARHCIMPEFGENAQWQFMQKKIIMVGAGGIAHACLPYLVASGLQNLVIIDDDVVEESNLSRQLGFRAQDIGQLKSVILSKYLQSLNLNAKITPIIARITKENAGDSLQNADLIIDGTDNMASRLLINQAAVHAKIALLSAGVSNFDGQLGFFAPHLGTNCYQCCFNQDTGAPNNCSVVGVLSPMLAILGGIIAKEAMLFCANLAHNYQDNYLLIDGLYGEFHQIKRNKRDNCAVCGQINSATKNKS